MRCLLIYDITHDGTRSKIADVCLDYGLERIQYSAFLGELSLRPSERILAQNQTAAWHARWQYPVVPARRKKLGQTGA